MYTTLVRVIRHALNKRWLLISALVLAACAQEAPEAEAEPQAVVERDFAAEADAIHDRVLVLDAHADIEIPDKLTRYAGPDGMSRVHPTKLRAGGVDAVVVAAGVSTGARTAEAVLEARATVDAEVASVHAEVAAESDVVLATTADDIEAAHAAGQKALILGFQNARSLGENVEGIRELFDQGVRVFALTHMGHNNFADSSRPVFNGETGEYEPDAEHGGLSSLGQEAVALVNELGGVVDISQLSKQAALQAIELSTAPVIASHSNVQALTNVRRNLSDEEIDRIGETGGVIHIAAFRGYLFDSNDPELDRRIKETRTQHGLPEKYDYPYELYWELEGMDAQLAYTGAISDLLGKGDVEVVVNHIDYVVDRIGVDHVGIGNDFNHGGGIENFTDASGARVITEALLRRGYTEAEIAKIWGGNFLRVMRAAEAG